MQKRAPTLMNLVVIVVFVLACFGLLLFLWESFGGPVPLKPKGYRFRADFPNGLQLSEQSDVRISGVPVGRVITVKPNSKLGTGHTEVTIEMAARYAPIRVNTRAILRQKTLLGETYVQLIPTTNTGPFLPDEAMLPRRQIEPSVTLDQILATFDPRTRQMFRLWQQSWANSFRGRGEDINSFFATLEPFFASANRLVGLLAAQEGAVTAVIHNTGVVFNALAGRDRQLEGLIVNGERTFQAAAAESAAFAAAFRALPAFEASSTIALRQIDTFANAANPYLEQFRAAERQLTPTVQALIPFSPVFEHYLVALGGWARASEQGLPAFERVLALTTPVLKELTPTLRNLNPFLQYLGAYLPELQAFFANTTAATQGSKANEDVETSSGQPRQHYLRVMNVLGPESLAVYPTPVGTNRANAYPHPGVFASLLSGLPVFSSASCANSAPAVSGPPNEYVPESLIKQLRGEEVTIEFLEGATTVHKTINKGNVGVQVANRPGQPNNVAAPPCRQQEPFTINGKTSQFPQITAER
jgi:virulence factor Mce-like protein